MNFLKKALCISLAALLLLSACACGTTTETPQDTSANTQAAGTDAEEEQKETLDIPATRYDGSTLIFLTRDEAEWSTTEIFAEQDNFNASNISEAVYTRNDIILQNYGVTINEYKVSTGEMPTKIQQAVSAGGDDFQAVISNSSVACSASTNGYIWDLNSVETSSIDLTKSWWDGKLAEGMTLNDMVFFATGDLLTSDNDATFGMMFNKKIASDFKLPNIYELVNNYEWTFDKLYEFEQTATQEKGGDPNSLDYDVDVAGFAMTNDSYYSMLYAGGVTVIARDTETGDPIYSLDVERAQNIAESAQRIFAKDYIVNMNLVSSTDVVTVGKTCFGDGHALFFGEVLQCVERMRDYDVNFGVIPYPMYDTNQKAYHHMMHKTGSVVSITRNINKDIEMVSSMIEAMAYYSQDTLTKQYYEINLTSKFAKDEESGPMIALILESRVYDLSYYYDWGAVMGTLTNALHEGAKVGIASSNKQYKQKVERAIKNALESIEKKYASN